MLPLEELKIFTGNGHPDLAREVCSYLGIELGKSEVFKFKNDNTFVRIQENIRSRDVFIIQPTCYPVNDNIMELLIMIDAAKRASAGRITAVLPYFGYGRSDKKDQPRVPISGRLIADLLTIAGANRILTVDFHVGQIQGFFNIPVDELTALPILANYFRKEVSEDWVVVAVDIGINKTARDFATYLDVPLAIIEKRRIGNHDSTETVSLIGDVKDKVALLFDDEIDTAGSVVSAAEVLKQSGASKILACCTHPIFSNPASSRLSNNLISQVVTTNTVPLNEDKLFDNLKILSIAPILGEAIQRIHEGLSVGALFSK